MYALFVILAVSIAAISGCCLIAYEIMRIVWAKLPKMTIPARLRVLVLIGPVFLIHIICIWVYAVTFLLIENFSDIGAVSGIGHTVSLTYESFLDCLYFSSSTYTSLGFGDLTPTHELRMLAAAEVLNGMVLIAWTASFTYLAMEKFWHLNHTHHGRREYD